VKTIRKAYPIVKSEIEEFTNNMRFKIKLIDQRKCELNAKANKYTENASTLKC